MTLPDTPANAGDDPSNGYEAVASEFMRRRRPHIGVATVRSWARSLAPGTSVLDLGCGHGVPVSMTLVHDGFVVYGVDASPTLAAAFRRRFPRAHVACEAVESSGFFARTFGGVVAVGLIFLLPPEVQRRLIRRVALALDPGGRVLFTSPARACTWADGLTGALSRSLGAKAYEAELLGAGLALAGEHEDEGGNHYFDACRPPARSPGSAGTVDASSAASVPCRTIVR